MPFAQRAAATDLLILALWIFHAHPAFFSWLVLLFRRTGVAIAVTDDNGEIKLHLRAPRRRRETAMRYHAILIRQLDSAPLPIGTLLALRQVRQVRQVR